MSASSISPEVRVRATELIDDFFGRVDRGESVADLLVEEAIFKTHQRFAEGRQNVADLLLSLAKLREETKREARHFGGNVTITRLSDNEYRVRSLVIVIALDRSGTEKGLLNMGDHDDIVVFDEAGACRFAKRTMSPVMQLEFNVPSPA